MEHFHKHSDLLDGIKDRIKDGEYKMLMESLAEIKNIKKEIFVKVIRISCQTTIYTETIQNDDDDHCETDLHTSINHYRYEVCNGDCQCGECSREPLKAVEINSELKTETKWLKVIDDEERKLWRSEDQIGCLIYDMLKKSKTYHMDRYILVYLEDNQ